MAYKENKIQELRKVISTRFIRIAVDEIDLSIIIQLKTSNSINKACK